MKTLATLVACNILFTLTATSHPMPVLKYRAGSVWVTGLGSNAIAESQWKETFRVYTADAFIKHVDQSIAGTYSYYGDSLSFTPSLSFAAGGKYFAVFQMLELSFSLPKELSSTFIETVHPQANILPENMLRMYISFSGPMMPGEAYEHIKLVTENGTLVEKAFLVIDQELWDADRKRFTLLFDPGRIKRGIQSQVELGAPLQAGHTYRLVIDSMWRDAHGNSLAGNYSKQFTVTPAERSKLSVQHWKIIAPEAGTTQDMLIELDHPIDYVLAMKYITITTAKGGKVNGTATFANSRYWRFTPAQPWLEGQYQVEVYPQIEDVAGNNVSNAFDIDLSKDRRSNSTEPIKLPFFTRSTNNYAREP